MAGRSGPDQLVLGGRGGAPGIAGDHAPDPLDVLEHRLDAPEAAAGKHGRLEAAGLWRGTVDRRCGQDPGPLGAVGIVHGCEAGGRRGEGCDGGQGQGECGALHDRSHAGWKESATPFMQ